MSNVLNESAENYLETILILSQKLPERHTLLSSWLIHLGVPADVAAADACKMEHVISKESFEAIKRHVYENKEV